MEVNLKEIKLPDSYDEFEKVITLDDKTYLINYQGTWRTGWFEIEITMGDTPNGIRACIPPIGGFQLYDAYYYILFKNQVNGIIYEIDSLFVDIKYSAGENS